MAAQSCRYEQTLSERIAQFGEERFNTMKDHISSLLGDNFKMHNVMLIARKTESESEFRIDHFSRRKLDALILCVCEHYEQIGVLFEQNITEFLQNPEAFQKYEEDAETFQMYKPDVSFEIE